MDVGLVLLDSMAWTFVWLLLRCVVLDRLWTIGDESIRSDVLNVHLLDSPLRYSKLSSDSRGLCWYYGFKAVLVTLHLCTWPWSGASAGQEAILSLAAIDLCALYRSDQRDLRRYRRNVAVYYLLGWVGISIHGLGVAASYAALATAASAPLWVATVGLMGVAPIRIPRWVWWAAQAGMLLTIAGLGAHYGLRIWENAMTPIDWLAVLGLPLLHRSDRTSVTNLRSLHLAFAL